MRERGRLEAMGKTRASLLALNSSFLPYCWVRLCDGWGSGETTKMNVGPSRIETLNSALSTVTLTTLEGKCNLHWTRRKASPSPNSIRPIHFETTKWNFEIGGERLFCFIAPLFNRCARSGDKYRFEAKSIAAKGSEEIREGENTKGRVGKKLRPLSLLFLTLSIPITISKSQFENNASDARRCSNGGEEREREGTLKKESPVTLKE